MSCIILNKIINPIRAPSTKPLDKKAGDSVKLTNITCRDAIGDGVSIMEDIPAAITLHCDTDIFRIIVNILENVYL